MFRSTAPLAFWASFLLTTPVIAADTGQYAPLSGPDDIPGEIARQLFDCPDAGDSGSFRVDYYDGRHLYLTPCRSEGVNSWWAAVVFANKESYRLSFPLIDRDGRQDEQAFAANVRPGPGGTLLSHFDSGCTGLRAEYILSNVTMVLLRLETAQGDAKCRTANGNADDEPSWPADYDNFRTSNWLNPDNMRFRTVYDRADQQRYNFWYKPRKVFSTR